MVATHMTPSQERKAGSLCVALGGPDEPAPAARAKKAGPRWCVLHDGKLTLVLPQPYKPDPNPEQVRAGEWRALRAAHRLVGRRGVGAQAGPSGRARRQLPQRAAGAPAARYTSLSLAACPTSPLPTLQAGAPHALFIELSPVPRSREGWQGVGTCVKLVLVAESAEEQAEWQTCLDRVATAYRNWRRVSDAPGVVLGGLKSVGNLALHAAGTGFGWQVGRDAGRAASRALGL